MQSKTSDKLFVNIDHVYCTVRSVNIADNDIERQPFLVSHVIIYTMMIYKRGDKYIE